MSQGVDRDLAAGGGGMDVVHQDTAAPIGNRLLLTRSNRAFSQANS